MLKVYQVQCYEALRKVAIVRRSRGFDALCELAQRGEVSSVLDHKFDVSDGAQFIMGVARLILIWECLRGAVPGDVKHVVAAFFC